MKDFLLFISMYLCLSVLLVTVYAAELCDIRFLLAQVKSIHVSESNI